MEKITYLINRLLNKQLALYETLHDIALKDREYIVNMDVDALWQTTQQKKKLALDIEHSMGDLFDTLKKEGVRSGKTKGKEFSLTSAVDRLDISQKERSVLKKMIQDIATAKQDLSFRADENKKYLSDYLGVIDGIFSTVMPQKNKGRYSAMGQVEKTQSDKCLIQAQV